MFNNDPSVMGPDFSLLANILQSMGVTGGGSIAPGGTLANGGGTPSPLDILFNPRSAVAGDVGMNPSIDSNNLLGQIIKQLLNPTTNNAQPNQPAAATAQTQGPTFLDYLTKEYPGVQFTSAPASGAYAPAPGSQDTTMYTGMFTPTGTDTNPYPITVLGPAGNTQFTPGSTAGPALPGDHEHGG